MKQRPPAIRSGDYAKAFPDRLAIHRKYRRWNVWRGWDILEDFPTHAEAIEYAHEQATRQALAARFTIPPENPVARAIQEGA